MNIIREWESVEPECDRKAMKQFDRLPNDKQDKVRSALACLQWIIFEFELSAYTVVDPVNGKKEIQLECLSLEQMTKILHYALKSRNGLQQVVGITNQRKPKHVEWPEIKEREESR